MPLILLCAKWTASGRSLFIALVLPVIPLVSVCTAQTPERPNIVFILSDDHRADLMGVAGDPYIRTPNLDKLAAEGVRFTNAFTVSGTCSPSRAAFWTGRHSHAASAPNITQQNNSFLGTQTVFPEFLHDAGYHTAFMGKWHLGLGTEPKRGFDYWAGWAHGVPENQIFFVNGKEVTTEGFTDDALSEMAADYIREAGARKEPFFLYVGLRSPHRPFAFPDRLADAFAGVGIPRPTTFDEDYRASGKDPILERCRIRAKNMSFYKSFRTWDKFVKSYYRSAQSIDDSVGAIMDALKKSGVEDNTIVVYSSDHGYNLGEHGMVEKHFAYEPVMRIPFILRWPNGIPGGFEADGLALSIDLAPTLLMAAGIEVPETVQGRSLAPLIRDVGRTPDDWRKDVLFVFESRDGLIPGQIALRTKRYKLIHYTDRPTVELYDLEKDPDEAHSVAGDPEYAEILKAMTARLDERLGEVDYRPRPTRQTLPFVWGLRGLDEAAVAAVSGWYAEHSFDPRSPLEIDGETYVWDRIEAERGGKFTRKAVFGDSADGSVLLGIRIDRKIAFDPHVAIWVAPWPLTRLYEKGKAIWEYDPSDRIAGNLANPALPEATNLVLLSVEEMRQPFTIFWEAPLNSVVVNGETHQQ